MAAKSKRPLTEIELCVLGIVWLRGPCSAYVVRRELAVSQSSFWSSSAGSVYPIIKRLLAARLVAAKTVASDGRGKRNLAISAEGERVLQSWLTELPAWTGMAGLDPIRARMNFFGVLKSARDQLAFLDLASAHTRAQIEKEKVLLKQFTNVHRLTHLGALAEVEARKRWLGEVRKMLSRRNTPFRN